MKNNDKLINQTKKKHFFLRSKLEKQANTEDKQRGANMCKIGSFKLGN